MCLGPDSHPSAFPFEGMICNLMTGGTDSLPVNDDWESLTSDTVASGGNHIPPGPPPHESVDARCAFGLGSIEMLSRRLVFRSPIRPQVQWPSTNACNSSSAGRPPNMLGNVPGDASPHVSMLLTWTECIDASSSVPKRSWIPHVHLSYQGCCSFSEQLESVLRVLKGVQSRGGDEPPEGL